MCWREALQRAIRCRSRAPCMARAAASHEDGEAVEFSFELLTSPVRFRAHYTASKNPAKRIASDPR